MCVYVCVGVFLSSFMVQAGELALPLPKDTRLDSAHDIIQIVRAPSDDVIAAVTRGNQIYTVPSGFSGTLKVLWSLHVV